MSSPIRRSKLADEDAGKSPAVSHTPDPTLDSQPRSPPNRLCRELQRELNTFLSALSLGILQSALKFEYHQSSMSKMKPDRKPLLAKSPIRLLPSRVLESNSNCMPTPAGWSGIGFEQTDKILTSLVFHERHSYEKCKYKLGENAPDAEDS